MATPIVETRPEWTRRDVVRAGTLGVAAMAAAVMTQSPTRCLWGVALLLIAFPAELHAQKPPYDVFPPAEPPYYRVRYEASTKPGELIYPVNYTIWIPSGVKTLRGVIVHQHGCGEGSCKSGLTGAYDLHWQALAKKHDCALLSPCLRATGEGRLSDVVRSAQRLRRGVSEVPRRSRREVGPSRAGEGAVGAVGTQRRRALGRRHGAAASRTASPPRGCARACRC